MKKISSTIPHFFLQVIIILIGIGALTFLVWEPHVEGVNANATTLAEIYLDDPFLAYAYASSILFFVLLYQAFRVVGYAKSGIVLSPATLRAVRIIKYCALALIGLAALPAAYLLMVRPGDDIAGGVAMGLALIFIFSVTAAGAAVGERVVKNLIQ